MSMSPEPDVVTVSPSSSYQTPNVTHTLSSTGASTSGHSSSTEKKTISDLLLRDVGGDRLKFLPTPVSDKSKPDVKQLFAKFTCVELDGNLTSYLSCTDCKHLIKYPVGGRISVSNLRAHKSVCVKPKANGQTTLDETLFRSQDDKKAITAGKLKRAKQLLRGACGRFIIKDKQPFRSIENEGMREVVAAAIQVGQLFGKTEKLPIVNEVMPSRRSVKRDTEEMFKFADKENRKVIREMLVDKAVAITLDFWQDPLSQKDYAAANLHFMDKWRMRVLTITAAETDFKKTFGNNKIWLEEVVNEYGLSLNDENVTVITDGGTNLVAIWAFTNGRIPPKSTRLDCFAHKLHNAVNKAFDAASNASPRIHQTYDKSKNCVTFMRRSGLHKKMVGKKLIQECKTRWLTNHAMLKSIFDAYSVITSLLTNHNNGAELGRIADIEECMLGMLARFLEPFSQAVHLLEADRSPTLYYVLPVLHKLIIHCNTPEKPSEEKNLTLVDIRATQGPREVLAKSMVRCLENLYEFVSPKHYQATLLNPVFRQMEHKMHNVTKQIVDDTKAQIVNMMTKISNPPISQAVSGVSSIGDDDEPKEKRARNVGMMDVGCEDSDDDEIVGQLTPEAELEAYLLMKPVGKISLLQWWKEHAHAHLFPRLAIIAARLHSIPATEATSERIFSEMDALLTSKRNRLRPETVNMLVVIAAYYRDQEAMKE